MRNIPLNALGNYVIPIRTLVAALFALFMSAQVTFSQNDCSGKDILTEKSCSGDELSSSERELARLVNDWRKQNNLAEISLSESLSLVANRHVLDISKNLGYLTHSWSDCPYNARDAKTLKCVFDAPKRFIPDFSGIGFENAYYTTTGKVIPGFAVESWKKSRQHNSAMLNQAAFKDFKWLSIGVAINGRFAALWFSSASLGSGSSTETKEEKGLGVTFSDAVKGLTSVISINTASSSIGTNKWIGTSSDKSVRLEMYGKTADISEGKMTLRLRTGKSRRLSTTNRRILGTFARNLTPNWAERESWLNVALRRLRRAPSRSQKISVQNISIELGVDRDGFILLTVKPARKAVLY